MSSLILHNIDVVGINNHSSQVRPIINDREIWIWMSKKREQSKLGNKSMSQR